jgi:predicted RND superfamily exporter protein
MWVQLTSGDNKDMEKVVRATDKYLAMHPAPVPIRAKWFGLTYINVIWQNKMVVGMLRAFAGSFLVVFLLMTILFRSALWGLLSMIPLTVTIAAIYGAVGLVGKDYDMPVAILSSLTLGLAVDFAIHFLVRARQMHGQYGTWQATAPHMFSEPARAISRNIIVIAAGFTPLLLAPLLPYRTVGVLLATILLVSGAATLLLLPALMRLMEKKLFRTDKAPVPAGCNCGLCVVASLTATAIIAMSL